jgi:hypothetical protein
MKEAYEALLRIDGDACRIAPRASMSGQAIGRFYCVDVAADLIYNCCRDRPRRRSRAYDTHDAGRVVDEREFSLLPVTADKEVPWEEWLTSKMSVLACGYLRVICIKVKPLFQHSSSQQLHARLCLDQVPRHKQSLTVMQVFCGNKHVRFSACRMGADQLASNVRAAPTWRRRWFYMAIEETTPNVGVILAGADRVSLQELCLEPGVGRTHCGLQNSTLLFRDHLGNVNRGAGFVKDERQGGDQPSIGLSPL